MELAVTAVGASAFLILVPERSIHVELGLVALALVPIGLGARETRRRVWADDPGPDRRRHAGRVLVTATIGFLLVLLAGGALLGRQADASVPLVFLATVACFVPWAWLQQVLFQFYLLGRLADAGDGAVVAVTGLLFGAMHAPRWDLVAVTVLAGWLWSSYYLRARRLWPIALSHAVLGATYLSWFRGEDLLRDWLGFAF